MYSAAAFAHATKRSLRRQILVHRRFSLNSRDHTFAILGLKSFSEPEIVQSFQKLQDVSDEEGQAVNVQDGIKRIAETEYPVKLDHKTISKVIKLVSGTTESNSGKAVTLTLPEYRKRILELGEKLDPRVWNIGLSFLFTGIINERDIQLVFCDQ